MNSPKISVVTVCYNAADIIEGTILSVINQTYDNIEYIIIDGASTDGTIEVVNKYRDNVAHFVSEPDKGIYDAMNKGIKLASGEWINFMNAGDVFIDNGVIMNMFSDNADYEGCSVLYGDSKYMNKWGWFELIPDSMDIMKYHTPFCHQSSFIRTSIIKAEPYDTQYKFAADFNFFHDIWKKGHDMRYVPMTVAVFDGSIKSYSGENPFSVKKEEKRISGDNSLKNAFMFFLMRFIIVCSKILRFIPFRREIQRRRLHNNKLIKSFEIY